MSLIRSDISNTYVGEMQKYQELLVLGNSRSTNSGTWISPSSNASYTYTSETDLMNKLKNILQFYMITASDWNTILNGTYNYITTTNTGNAYVANTNIGLLPLNEGFKITLKFNAYNTGASTLNVESLGAKNIKKMTINGKANVDIGDIIANGIYALTYDGTDFILMNPTATPISSNFSFLQSTNTDTYVVANAIPYRSYVTGMTVSFKADIVNTGIATLNVDNLGAKTIKKVLASGLVDLDDGDILASSIVTVVYDGTYFVLQTQPWKPTLQKQTFTSSGTFTAIVNGWHRVICTGGGGSKPYTGSAYCGGGAGGTAIKWVWLTKGTAVTVTVGSGGVVPTSSTVGANGGTSSFGAYCSGVGGSGGYQYTSNNGGYGSGGSASGGDINITGGNSGYGWYNSGYTNVGSGGSSYWGGEGSYGSGNAWGNGYSGIVIVEW